MLSLLSESQKMYLSYRPASENVFLCLGVWVCVSACILGVSWRGAQVFVAYIHVCHVSAVQASGIRRTCAGHLHCHVPKANTLGWVPHFWRFSMSMGAAGVSIKNNHTRGLGRRKLDQRFFLLTPRCTAKGYQDNQSELSFRAGWPTYSMSPVETAVECKLRYFRGVPHFELGVAGRDQRASFALLLHGVESAAEQLLGEIWTGVHTSECSPAWGLGASIQIRWAAQKNFIHLLCIVQTMSTTTSEFLEIVRFSEVS